ncbi:7258_t:CDS:1, partial [Dentiscutata erythropus]
MGSLANKSNQLKHIIGPMPSDNHSNVNDFELGKFNNDDTQNLEEN